MISDLVPEDWAGVRDAFGMRTGIGVGAKKPGTKRPMNVLIWVLFR